MMIYGASGHAKVIVDILGSKDIRPDFIVDDNPDINELMGIEVRRNTGVYDSAIIAIGSNHIRKKLVGSLNVKEYITAIDNSAIISSYSTVGNGTVIMQGAIIQACSTIGQHCIINTGATVDHDCMIKDYVHISPNATLCGNVEIGEGSWIGAGSVIKQGIKIGKWSIIGAGSVIVEDVPDNVVVYGKKSEIKKQL